MNFLITSILYIFLFAIAFGGCFTCNYIGCDYEYSSGQRTGELYKFSRKGIIFKTWEGELNLGGMRKTDQGMVANTWAFSVTDSNVIEKLNQTMNDGNSDNNTVTVEYSQKVLLPMMEGGTNYLAVDATVNE